MCASKGCATVAIPPKAIRDELLPGLTKIAEEAAYNAFTRDPRSSMFGDNQYLKEFRAAAPAPTPTEPVAPYVRTADLDLEESPEVKAPPPTTTRILDFES
jgi:hypothetical protein